MKQLLKNWSYSNNLPYTKHTKYRLVCFGFLLLLFWGEAGKSIAQNLVPNSSFETFSNCPTNLNGGSINLATPWYTPTGESSDYFNSCDTGKNGSHSVPFGGGGYQYARTGNAYAGIWIAYNGADYREYLQVKLSDTLKINKCYYIQFYANLTNWVTLACNNLAANISNTPISSTGNGSRLNLNSDILLYGNPIITDTLNWIKIGGIYNAKGGEDYVTIGNFKDDAHTDTVSVNGPVMWLASYYYIDDVSVTEITGSFVRNWSYRDTSITKGDSVFIGTRTGGLKCTWYNNNQQIIADSVPGLYVKPAVTSTYIVKENLPCAGVRYDTLVVSVTPNGINELAGSQFESLKVWPNPLTDGILHITGTSTLSEVEVYNLLGEKVMESKAPENIDLSRVPKGMYFIKFCINRRENVCKVLIQ